MPSLYSYALILGAIAIGGAISSSRVRQGYDHRKTTAENEKDTLGIPALLVIANGMLGGVLMALVLLLGHFEK